MWFMYSGGITLRQGVSGKLVLGWIVCFWIALSPGITDPVGERVAALKSICKIQGDWFISPYEGETIRTRGVVFADLDHTTKRGFFMQTAGCDDTSDTSDGIFVYLGTREDVVRSGDLVEVTGVVQEYYGMTEINTTPDDVTLISSDHPLPPPVDLAPPFDRDSSHVYYESLEGMYIALDEAAVVGPTNNAGETWVVRADLGITRVFQDDPGGTGEIICVDDEGLYEIAPEVKVGDRVLGLKGALEYSFGVYRTQLISQPSVVPGVVPSEDCQELGCPFNRREGSFNFSVATFNLANLFDTYDDPATEDTVLSAAEYRRRLQKRAQAIYSQLEEPALLAIQEAENLQVIQDLVARPEIEMDYGIVWQDGPDFRGIDLALLYRSDQVTLLDSQWLEPCTSLVDGLGPDGNRDVNNPYNAVTCDTDGDGVLDGNRLFSRPPLVAHLNVCPTLCQASGTGESDPIQLTLVVNHWKSKVQDTPKTQHTLPRRLEQAQFIAEKVREIRGSGIGSYLIVLGDMNDYPDSEPLSILQGAGLSDLVNNIPKPQRYTFIHQGVSQVLDYVLVVQSPWLAPTSIVPIHINADYPAVYSGVDGTVFRCSDHDLLITTFTRPDDFTFLPMVSYE